MANPIIWFLGGCAVGGVAVWLGMGQPTDPGTMLPGGAGRDPLRRALAAAESKADAAADERDDLRRRLAKLNDRLAALESENASLTAKAAGLETEVSKLNSEWTFSYGSVRDAGRFVGSLFKDALAMRNLDPNDPEAATKARDMFLKFASLGPILQEMQGLDDKPREFAEFRAEVLGEAIGLDPAGKAKVAAIVEKYKTQALALPEDDPRRGALNQTAMDEVRIALPEEQRAAFDLLPSTRMGGMADLLETPSLDPAKWRERMERNRRRE